MEDPILSLDCLRPSPNNPRKNFDEARLAELAESIRATGLLEPIVARQTTDGDLVSPLRPAEIIAGERRYRAAKLAGLESVPVRMVRLDDQGAAEAMLAENLQRADLTPIEEARAFEAWCAAAPKAPKGERQNLPRDLGAKIGKSEDYVRERLLLLALDDKLLRQVDANKITLAVAVAVARVDDLDARKEIARMVGVNSWMDSAAKVKEHARYIVEERRREEKRKAQERDRKPGAPSAEEERWQRESRDRRPKELKKQRERAETHQRATAAAYEWVRQRTPEELAKLAVEAMARHLNSDVACATARLLGFYNVKKRFAMRDEVEKRAREAQGKALKELLCALIIAEECGESYPQFSSGSGAASAFCKRHGVAVPKPKKEGEGGRKKGK